MAAAGLRYEDVQDEADWDPGRKSNIIRLVAEKTQFAVLPGVN